MGQILATLADKYPRRDVMIASDLVRAAAFGAILFSTDAWVVLALAFVAGLATPPFEAARAAVLPEILDEDSYGDGLALGNVTYQFSLILGYAAGGGLVAAIGPRTAVLVNTMTFLASGLIIAGMRRGERSHASARVATQLKAAFKTLSGDPFLRRAAMLATLAASGATIAEALITVYVKQHGGGAVQIGVLAASVAVGTIIAGAVVPTSGEHPHLLKVSAAVVIIGCALSLPLFLMQPQGFAAIPAYAAIGVIFAVVIPANTVVGSRLPKDIRASAFGLMQGLLLGGQALAAIGGGVLAVAVGPARASAIGVAVALAYGLFALTVKVRPALGLPDD